MAPRGRPRKDITTRDPAFTVRDPVIIPHTQEDITEATTQQRRPRRFIAASMPCVCPDCGHNTRMDNGRHVDPVRGKILEYRTCIRCGALLAAGRNMTATEKQRLCSRADAVKEYEEIESAKA